jgi:adenosylcobinamide kinase/adenosylcobinamide-phosphate guanylyltransferase
MTPPRTVLVMGGARSGKSRYAESCGRAAAAAGRPVSVIATARIGDDEMRARIERHRAERPATWRTVEAPLGLGAALVAADQPGGLLIVDCLTLWLTNLIAPLPGTDSADLAAERDALLGALQSVRGEVILIGNEIGQGVMPIDALTRRFIDEAGWLHQAIARQADEVVWMVAGCPVWAKGAAPAAYRSGLPATPGAGAVAD